MELGTFLPEPGNSLDLSAGLHRCGNQESKESPQVLKNMTFYRRSREEYQEIGCPRGGKLKHLGQDWRKEKKSLL